MNDIKHLHSRLPKVMFMQTYCTTECGAVTGCFPKNYAESMEKIGTVGHIMQNCKIKVVDLDTRKDVGPEVVGELLVTGDCQMLG